jgi:hypothetical protein
MKMMAIMTACVLASGGVLARESAQTTVAGEVELALLRAADRGALPGPDEAPLRIETPASTRYELGAVIDPSSTRGPTVIALTPGGAAERMGLHVGDRLLAVNGSSLATLPQPLDVMRDALVRDQGDLALDVERAEQRLALNGRADALTVPAYAMTISSSASTGNCGRISVFFTASRSDDLYPARIIYIDGKTPLLDAPSWRVKPGKRTLTVADDIEPVRFNAVQQRQRAFRFEDHYKTLEIDVNPDTTYQIAARFHLGGNVIKHEHWEPVVARESHESCR